MPTPVHLKARVIMSRLSIRASTASPTQTVKSWRRSRAGTLPICLRKVGIPVDGPYLQAKMLQLVPETPGADPVKVKNFKATDKWLQGFKKRKGISVRVQINKKSRSQFKRSRMVRNFHYYTMYNAPLETRYQEYYYDLHYI